MPHKEWKIPLPSAQTYVHYDFYPAAYVIAFADPQDKGEEDTCVYLVIKIVAASSP